MAARDKRLAAEREIPPSRFAKAHDLKGLKDLCLHILVNVLVLSELGSLRCERCLGNNLRQISALRVYRVYAEAGLLIGENGCCERAL